MDDSSYRLNFDLGSKSEIRQKKHFKISRIAREML